MPTVLIADDHPLFRRAMRGVLRTALPEFDIAEASSLAEIRKRVSDDHDLVLLDLALPDATGFDALLALRRQVPSVPIVVVSALADLDTVRTSATYGAAGFIPKTAAPAEIVQAVRAVLAGGRWWPQSGAPAATRPARDEDAEDPMKSLSKCEARVLGLLAQGKSNKVIAYDLGIKESTVKSHITSLLRKLGVHSRMQAVLLAKGMQG